MAKGPEIPQTDSAEIEILIERLKQNKLEQRDVELIERLLRTVLVLVNLLQRKNISIKRLREMIFGRHTEKRKAMNVSLTEEPAQDQAFDRPQFAIDLNLCPSHLAMRMFGISDPVSDRRGKAFGSRC